MQDRYAGDVGDYVKLGLLRALTAADEEPALSLGVMWYRTEDEFHNEDGKHVGYLKEGTRSGRQLCRCDPDLYARLQRVVSGRRSVQELERAGVLPERTRTHSALVSARRAEWLEEGLQLTAGGDIVFFDPDNGLTTPARRPLGRLAVKFVFPNELAVFAERDQSLVVYQHTDRSAPVSEQAARRLAELGKAIGRPAWGAVRCHRGTSRLFLIAPAARHQDTIERRAIRMVEGAWSAACTLIDPGVPVASSRKSRTVSRSPDE